MLKISAFKVSILLESNSAFSIIYPFFEYINPFLAQILYNFGRKTYFIHMSRWLNNQYFCEKFVNKVKGNLFILVSSEFEYERIRKQGFDHDSIIRVHENYFDNNYDSNI